MVSVTLAVQMNSTYRRRRGGAAGRPPPPPLGPGPRRDTHLGQVHRHVQVVIQEVGILLGVQQLKQRRRGVPLVAPANLVHLKGVGVCVFVLWHGSDTLSHPPCLLTRRRWGQGAGGGHAQSKGRGLLGSPRQGRSCIVRPGRSRITLRGGVSPEMAGATGVILDRPHPVRTAWSSGSGRPEGLTALRPRGRALGTEAAPTSSIRINGFSVLVFFRHWMIFPGMAPTYVRLGGAGGGRAQQGVGASHAWGWSRRHPQAQFTGCTGTSAICVPAWPTRRWQQGHARRAAAV